MKSNFPTNSWQPQPSIPYPTHTPTPHPTPLALPSISPPPRSTHLSLSPSLWLPLSFASFLLYFLFPSQLLPIHILSHIFFWGLFSLYSLSLVPPFHPSIFLSIIHLSSTLSGLSFRDILSSHPICPSLSLSLSLSHYLYITLPLLFTLTPSVSHYLPPISLALVPYICASLSLSLPQSFHLSVPPSVVPSIHQDAESSRVE